MRRVLTVLATAAIALLLVACTPEEATHLEQLNAFRTGQGLPALQWEEGAYQKAHDWSQHLADAGRLSHSTLSAGVPAGWHTLGENVAYAPTLEAAQRALEKSPGHRANMLNPAFTKVAVGVVHQGGMYWVTQVFIG